jgi:hypothetical protein
MGLVDSTAARLGLCLMLAGAGCAAPEPPALRLRDRALTLWAERWDAGGPGGSAPGADAGLDTLWVGGPERRQTRLRFALPPRPALGRAELSLSTLQSWPGSTAVLHLGVRVETGDRVLRATRRTEPPVWAELLPTPRPALEVTLGAALAAAWARHERSVWLRISLRERASPVPLASPSHPDRGRRPRLVLY